MNVQIIDAGHPLRGQAENHVRQVFREHYGATVRNFPPLLVALLDDQERPTCVAGVRFEPGDWFSGCYFDAPLHEVLSASLGRDVAEDSLLEVTGLASTRFGASFHLLQHIVNMGRDQGKQWGVFTATAGLRRIIKASCLPMLDLGPAESRWVANPKDWGSYYDARPRICAMPDSIAEPLTFFAEALAIRGRKRQPRVVAGYA